MTQRRILELAYYEALALWNKEKEELDLWDSDYNKFKERKARAELDEIAQLLYNEEHEVN